MKAWQIIVESNKKAIVCILMRQNYNQPQLNCLQVKDE